MNFAAYIPLRKSVRNYTDEPVGREILEKIAAFIEGARPLYPELPFRWQLLERSQVKCFFPWTAPHCIAIYAPDVPGAPENVGFIFQQLDLYLCSLGLGACWLGLGKPAKTVPAEMDGMKFAMMITFGHPRGNARRKGAADFRRMRLSEISDREDLRLEGARLAPSSVNSQPWRFTHEGEILRAHCAKKALALVLNDMNLIDMGIALAHIYLNHPDSFSFFREEGAAPLRGCNYVGSFML